jgi:hypothetical protein
MGRYLFAIGILLLVGCAVNSGVVSTGPDTFIVSRQAATGFTGLGDLKAQALREANQFCAGKGKSMEVISTDESKPPYIFGNFPRVEVQFRCIEAAKANAG